MVKLVFKTDKFLHFIGDFSSDTTISVEENAYILIKHNVLSNAFIGPVTLIRYVSFNSITLVMIRTFSMQ